MHFVGIDLARGDTKPSGVAVLDTRGRLVHLSSQTSDEAITAAVAAYTRGPCVLAVDAPLVAASGPRPGEAALNRDFARFDAGTQPAGTGRSEPAPPPRAGQLVRALGLVPDPASGRARRAIEVSPQPAAVALFGLGRTLKYKPRSGRGLPELRAALLQLVAHLESLADADPPLLLEGQADWRAVLELLESAGRKSDLRRVEDRVEAVLCAYVARYATAHPERITSYGDRATGTIVTPTLPEGHRPTPRPRAVGPDLVHRAVQTYAALHPTVISATAGYVALVTTLLDDAGINYLSVTGRTKGVASFAGKANRRVDGRPAFPDPLRQITDQIGVRVITYVHRDVEAVADLLADQLRVLDDRDMGLETAQEGRFGYASRHVLVALDEGRAAEPAHGVLRDRVASVQVRTVLQHAWAEFEHEIRYKGTVPEEHAPDLDRRFTLAAGLLELADREFSTIRDRLQQSTTGPRPETDPADPRISAQDLASFLSRQFADAGWSRTEHYAWVAGLLLELGITSLPELGGLLGSVDSAAISDRMGYRYPPGAVRRLDDALLAVFGDRYLELHGNDDRVEALRVRLERLRD